MEPTTAITWGLASGLTGAFLAGVSTLAFLASRLRQLRDELIAEIHQARSESDKKIDVLAGELRATEERLQRHELHVAQNFIPRAAVEDGFGRIEKAIASAMDRIDARFEKVEAKLEQRD
ncbi:MAG: hypothetical protein AB7O95_01855 [Geminicoccaceae bacterium]